MMTREEALNKVREMKLSPGKDAELIIALHTLIPELAESEDERIRKRIILRLQYELEQNSNKFTKKEIPEEIAYLEKQKEHNLEDIEDDAVRKYMKLDKFALANMLAERDKTNAEVIETFESIEEQPTESEDERIMKDIITTLSIGVACDESALYPGACTTLKEALAYLEKQKELPTNEEMLRTLHVEYEKGVADTIAKYEQKEPKPIEWSEEDEKMLVGIIERGSSQIPPHEPALREEQMEWLMNRLKSLRPESQGTYKQAIYTIFGMLKDKDFYFYELQPSHMVSLLNDIRVKCKDAIGYK